MLAGESYNAQDKELVESRIAARAWMQKYNGSAAQQVAAREKMLGEIFKRVGRNVLIEPPLYCDYGYNITLGDNVYMNFNCTLLDCNKIEIDDRTLLGPNVQVYTATHSTDANVRRTGAEHALPIKV